jgi:predicted small integral membrane protein
MFDWMVWTTPVAIFFICIACMLAVMTVLEIKRPTTPRKGFLPLVTTRGDRLFIGLLVAAYINLGFLGLAGTIADWLSLANEPSIWWGFALSVVWFVIVMRKG